MVQTKDPPHLLALLWRSSGRSQVTAQERWTATGQQEVLDNDRLCNSAAQSTVAQCTKESEVLETPP
jgi:hypothetical protein